MVRLARAVLVLAVGLFWSLVVAPPDYQQGESVRIMYVHVPAAWMALSVYLFVAVASAVALVWRHPLAEIAARAAAPIGAAFTFVCLATGSLWGRPMWGAWWVWDARLTSVLVLFFLYLGYIALVNAFDDPSRGARAGSVLALVGVVNLPIIKFSVDWWNTLHQPASVMRLGGPRIDISMLVPLLVMAVGFTLLFAALLMLRMRTALNERKALALRLNAGAVRGCASASASGPLRPAPRRAVMGDIGAFLAMGGYAAFVWPAYGVALAVLGGLALYSRGGATGASTGALERLQQELRPSVDDPQAAELGLLGSRHGGSRRSDRVGAERVQRQSRILLQPERPEGKGGRAGSPGPDRRSGRGAEPVARRRRAQRLVPRHRRRDRCRGRLSGPAARSVPRGARRRRRGKAARRRGLRRHRACWPSTTRTTCRARLSTR